MNYRVIPMDAQTWRIEEIAQPVDSYMYLLTGSEKAMLIDTGYGGIDLPRVVGELTSLPVMVVNTHYHGDHVGGNPYFTEIYMHSADRDLYPRRQEILKKSPLCGKLWRESPERPVHWIEDGHVFDLGGRQLQVIHTPGHSPGCICLLDGPRRWLFTGDTCCKADVLLNCDGSTAPEVYARSIDRLQALRPRFDVTWPGHHAVPVEPEILDQFAEGIRRVLGGDRGNVVETNHGPATKLLYKDIGIICPLEKEMR